MAEEAHHYIGVVPADEFVEVADAAGFIIAPVYDLIICVPVVGVVKNVIVHTNKVMRR